ncbi:hypothetical protein M3I54_22670 [Paraburkholderia sp. CNPSo 3274]|uniref:hypothetical protein n=1 Tax=Paraburkholderia sp. CNPSo 3274 TaxID=2940932 RepID=UPI0020B8CCEC|nr:hypothetical protein [Paraburkholderia sp. CNPSo 3274]MCP3709751.1 hypothetical protein [Paraburkholderia sp. CNPSo 3274]
MARARNIKPGFYTNEDLAECSVWARYIFPGLWMMADREGRLEYRPKKIKGELLRFDQQAAEPLLDELQRWGFIEIYEVEGRKFIQIMTFSKHQNPHHREAESDIPPPKSPGLTPLGNSSKPGATDGLDYIEAQGEPETSPGMEVEDETCQGGQAGLIPDSGFSDSLIPDSGSPSVESSVVHTNAGEENPDGSTSVSRAIEIAVYLRQRGVVGANSVNPYIAGWGDDARVTNEILDAAISKARASLNGKHLGPNYLATVVPDLLNPQPVQLKPKRDDWHRTDAGIKRKADELGVKARAGWGYDQLKDAVFEEIRRLERQGAAA